MIGTDTLDRVIGADVYDADGDKIGTASEVFLDDQSGNPEWVTVKTGLFGTKETFVPIRDADLTGNGVRVPVSKAAVKDAPKIDAEGHLSPQEEQELYRHYGMGTGAGGRTDTTTAGGPTTTTTTTSGRTDTTSAGFSDTGTTASGRPTSGQDADDSNRYGTVGHDTSGPTTDDAMTRSEEQLRVGTTSEEVGRARLRKYVVTEDVSTTVPVSREEVRVEREPITDGNVGSALDGPAISEEEHEVTLHAERPVVEKEAVPVERVRLDTEAVTDEVTVDETVRKEQIDADGDTDLRGDSPRR
ncbi:MAG: uncharacterized protein JWR62_2188 [Modestobacter sp.]|jgi:uncharacterized protein (TIGR02271 family)|nr:uncharacterized protein [Modestobacter sp.]